jgi:hypothetical protein
MTARLRHPRAASPWQPDCCRPAHPAGRTRLGAVFAREALFMATMQTDWVTAAPECKRHPLD